MRNAVLRPRCWSGSISSFSPRSQAHVMTLAALLEVQTVPPCSPQKPLMAAVELMYVTGTTLVMPSVRSSSQQTSS